jgi:pentatricopeptide repeat protein
MYRMSARCRQILAAAKDGRAEDAVAVLESMEAAGLPPGPRAYHGLICAHCKARDTDSALAAVRKAVLQGAGSPHMSTVHAQQAFVSCCVFMHNAPFAEAILCRSHANFCAQSLACEDKRVVVHWGIESYVDLLGALCRPAAHSRDLHGAHAQLHSRGRQAGRLQGVPEHECSGHGCAERLAPAMQGLLAIWVGLSLIILQQEIVCHDSHQYLHVLCIHPSTFLIRGLSGKAHAAV